MNICKNMNICVLIILITFIFKNTMTRTQLSQTWEKENYFKWIIYLKDQFNQCFSCLDLYKHKNT